MSGKPVDTEKAADGGICPGLSCFVASEAEFRAAVEAGIAAFRAGPTFDLPTVEAELRDIIHAVE